MFQSIDQATLSGNESENSAHLSMAFEIGTPRGKVEVRRVASFEEYRMCEKLQDQVWGRDDIVRVTTLVLITAQNNGGMVIGAFVGGDRLVGFVCGYLGLTETGKVKQCSQLMAVHPDYRGARIGLALKLAQRRLALAQGVDLVTWTFDPLMSLNANLNVKKLGAVSSCYLRDFYGSGEGGLNGGLPTDRLLVEWWVDTPWVGERLESLERLDASPPPHSRGARWINDVVAHPRSGLPMNRRFDLDRTEGVLCLEIPDDFLRLKRQDLELARAWRQELREILEAYFRQGYHVTHFDRLERETDSRCGYVLRKWAGHSSGEMPPQLVDPSDPSRQGDTT